MFRAKKGSRGYLRFLSAACNCYDADCQQYQSQRVEPVVAEQDTMLRREPSEPTPIAIVLNAPRSYFCGLAARMPAKN